MWLCSFTALNRGGVCTVIPFFFFFLFLSPTANCCCLTVYQLTTGTHMSVELCLGLTYWGGAERKMKVVQGMDNDGKTRRPHVCMEKSKRACACVCTCVFSPPTPQSHTISTSAAHRRWCNNNITHLISSAYFASPAAPSLHIYHIHLIFRNKCSRKRIMHLPYAPFITDTFTWGFASMVSNGALFTGVPRIC